MTQPDGTYKIGKYSVDLDLTQLMENAFEALGKNKDKYVLHMALAMMSGHLIELTKVLSQSFPELVKRMPKFFDKRLEDHRRSLRGQKVWGRRSLSSIEEEAVEKTWMDVRRMVQEVSLLQDEGLKAVAGTYREILRTLCQTMTNLMLEQGPNVRLDMEGVRKFLEGEVK